MRKELIGSDASIVSFPDCKIENFQIGEQTVRFRSDGAFVENIGLLDTPVQILITFGELRAREYVDGNWSEADPASTDPIREICEWKADSKKLVFAGFKAGSGAWSEFAITDVSVEISRGDQAA